MNAGPSLSPRAKSPSMKSSVGPSQSLKRRKWVMIWETWAKRKPFRHRCGPFRHAVGGVDAVMGGVEFQGPKLPAVVLWPRALGILLWINGTAPIADGPHGPTGPHFWLAPGRFDGQGSHAEGGRLNRMRPICPFRCAVNLAKFHNSNLQPTAVS